MEAELLIVKSTLKETKSKLSTFETVNKIVSGKLVDIDRTVQSYINSPEGIYPLATICEVLTSQMNLLLNEKKGIQRENSQLKFKVKEEINKASKNDSELVSLREANKCLTEDLTRIELENRNLMKKNQRLEDALISPSGDARSSALHRLLHESPAPASLRFGFGSDREDENISCTPEVVRSSCGTDVEQNELESEVPASPYLQLKFHSIKSLQNKSRSSSSITGTRNLPGKSSGTESSFYASCPENVGYDGMGGHHKLDEFPKPKPCLVKKRRLNSNSVRVLQKGCKPMTLDNFFSVDFNDS